MSAKSRVQLSDADRKVICELGKSHKSLSHQQLTNLIAQQLNKPELGRSTVTGILKQSEKWLKCSDSSASKTVKHRGAQHEKLEQALMAWFGQARSRGALIMDRFIVEKAISFAH